MGAKVVAAATETIQIEGVEKLTGTDHAIIPDRVEAGTFMVAAAVTQGNVLIQNVVSEHLRPVIAKLREMGVKIIERSEEHTSELQSRGHLVCRLLLEK